MSRAEPSPDPLALDRLHAVARRRPGTPAGAPADPPADARPQALHAPRRPTVDRGEHADPDGDGPARGLAAGRADADLGDGTAASEGSAPPGGTRWLPVRPPDDGASRDRAAAPLLTDGDRAGGEVRGTPPASVADLSRRGRRTAPVPEIGPDAAPDAGPEAGPGAGPDPGPGDHLRPHREAGPGSDVADVAARSRQRTLAAAAAGYTAAYGHPLDHPAGDHGGRRVRWWLSTRHAVVAGTAVVVLAAGVAVRASAELPDAPVATAPGVQEGVHAPVDPGAGAAVAGALAPGPPARATPDGAAPPTPPAGATPPAASAGVRPAPAGPEQPPTVVVHVVGQVVAPGVLTLPAGSRVADALAAAGGAGASADLSAVNLARVVVDGEQVQVPAHGEAPRPAPAAPPAAAGGASATGPVDLNAADVGALDDLPGIGPVLAQRIVDWRRDNGAFRSVEELGEVSGIGVALLTRLRPLVRV